MAEKLPERFGVLPDAVRRGDYKDRVVEHVHDALGLRRKINMAGGVNQCHGHVRKRENRLLGEDGDTAFALRFARVKERIPVVDAPHGADCACMKQQGFRQRRLPCIHFRGHADDNLLHGGSPFPGCMCVLYHISAGEVKENGSGLSRKNVQGMPP